jgi:hypothetical protein
MLVVMVLKEIEMKKLLLLLGLFSSLGFSQTPLLLGAGRFGVSVFDPLTISSLKCWYKSDYGITLSDTLVTQWLDYSGNSHTLTQAVMANQPVYHANRVNSLPAIQFNSINYLSLSANLTSLNPMAFYVVYKPESNLEQLVIDGDGSTYPWIYNFNNQFIGNNSISTSGVFANGNWYVVSGRGASSTGRIYVNTVNKGTTSPVYSNYDFFRNLGYFNTSVIGEIEEVLIFNDTLTSTQRTNMDSYFHSRTSIY